MISNWCLFSASPNKDYHIHNPYLSSNPNLSNTENDIQILNGLRQWLNNNFKIKNSLVYPNDIKLANRKQKDTNDSTVQIAGKAEYSSDIFYIIQDETQRCEIKTAKYFNFFEINDIIRIKSFKVNSNNQIEMNKDSNILIIPSYTDYHQEFTKKIEKNKLFLDSKYGLSLMMKSNDLSEQHSNLSDLCMNMNFYPNDLMLIDTPLAFIRLINEDGLSLVSLTSIEYNTQDRFLLEVKIEEIYPLPIKNIMNVMCENCKETYQLKEVSYNEGWFTCVNCSSMTNGKVHFNSYMKCREKLSDQAIIIHLCSYDDEGESFFGVKHVDLINNANDGYRQLSLHLKELVNKDVHIKIKVEAIEVDDNNCINNRIYRLIGNYETNYANEFIC